MTREALIDALSLLIDEKDYKDIKITELCARAGVSRQAFYRNFESLDHVMEERIRISAVEITEGLGPDIYQNWLHIFRVVERDRNKTRLLIKANLEHVMLKYLNSYLPIGVEERKLQAIWNAVIYNLIIDWVVDPRPASVQEMAELAFRLTKDIPPVQSFVNYHTV